MSADMMRLGRDGEVVQLDLTSDCDAGDGKVWLGRFTIEYGDELTAEIARRYWTGRLNRALADEYRRGRVDGHKAGVIQGKRMARRKEGGK